MLEGYSYDSVLDLGCGQGVFGRYVKPDKMYQGFDLSASFIEFARKHDESKDHKYDVADITGELPLEKKDFKLATCILALQNVEQPAKALEQAGKHLKSAGKLVLVINHPCFRIPRQSGWGIDEKQNTQYRRVTKYLSEMKIPVVAHPSKGEKSGVTWSTHFSLSALSQYLAAAGFVIETIEEWKSDKKSEGGAASRENRSRAEIPLFMAIRARKDAV